jgi:hypothetical protein
VIARALAATSVLVAIGVAGCGSGSGSNQQADVPGGADADVVRVIEQWADELRAGDVDAASDRFAIPSVVQNGTPPLRLSDRSEVREFNQSLPCGAKLTEAVPAGRFTIATFELTERPGPGECGSGVGETAKTAFVIHDGRITEWRRVAEQDQGAPAATGPVV